MRGEGHPNHCESIGAVANGIEGERETHRQTNRQTDRQTGRQTDTQTDRQR